MGCNVEVLVAVVGRLTQQGQAEQPALDQEATAGVVIEVVVLVEAVVMVVEEGVKPPLGGPISVHPRQSKSKNGRDHPNT